MARHEEELAPLKDEVLSREVALAVHEVLIEGARGDAACRVSELEGSLRVTRAARSDVAGEATQLLKEREAHLARLHPILWRLRGSLKDADVKLESAPAKTNLFAEHIAHDLGAITDKLRKLKSSIDATLEQEARELVAQVEEHVLMCFQSRDPSFDPEPARVRLVGRRDTPTDADVHAVVVAVSQLFSRDSLGPGSGDASGEGGASLGSAVDFVEE